MSIAKAEILTAVKARLGRSELTTIDTQLKAVMIDLSTRVAGALQKTDTVDIAAAADNGDLPADCVRCHEVTRAEGTPVEKATFEAIMVLKGNDPTAADDSEKWAVFQKKLYVWPPSANGHTLTIFERYEDNNVAAITFDDCFAEALIEGVCHKIELGFGVLGKGIPEEAVTHGNYYEKEVAVLTARYAGRAAG